jgi:hypothetical protein
MTKTKEKRIRAEMTTLLSKNPNLTPKLVTKAVDDAIAAIKIAEYDREHPLKPTEDDCGQGYYDPPAYGCGGY